MRKCLQASRLLIGLIFWGLAPLAIAHESLENLLGQLHSWEASFTQSTTFEGDTQITHGHLWIAKPNRFRFEVSGESSELELSDGLSFWQYQPDLMQVIVSPLAQMNLSNSPLLLLSQQPELLNSLYEIRQTQEFSFTLSPKKPDDLIRNVSLSFENSPPHALIELKILNHLNQSTQVHFEQVLMDPPLKPELFQFKVPEGVDVVQSTGV